MESTKHARNGSAFSPIQLESVSAPNNKNGHANGHEFIKEIAIKDALTVGADWLEASNGLTINESQYQNLFDSGYASFPISTVVESFSSWDNFLQSTTHFHSERSKEEAEKKVELYDSIMRQYDWGLIPTELLLKANYYRVCGPASGKKLNDRREFENSFATVDEIIQRYCRYVIVDHVNKDRPSNEEVPEERKINIAVGFTVQTSKPLAGFLGSIINTNANLTTDDVILAAEELGLYDYMFPQHRKEHYKTIFNIGNGKSVDVTPRQKPRIIQLEEVEKAWRIETHDVRIDIEQKRLLIGGFVVNSVQNSKPNQKKVFNLRELLLTKGLDYKLTDSHEVRRFNHLSKDECITYGKWLLNIIEDKEELFDKNLLQNAYLLGLGPGIKSLTNKQTRFRDLTEFYNTMRVRRRRTSSFTHWSLDTAVRHVKDIAEETGQLINRKMITERKKNGSAEPSYQIYEERWGGLGNVLRAAGFSAYNEELSAEACLEAGEKFFIENGRVPKISDIKKTDYLPSDWSIAKYCGGTAEFQKLILERVNNSVMAA